MIENSTPKARIGKLAINLLLILMALACILPVMHVLAVSFSSNAAVSAGKVLFVPVDFTVSSYEFALADAQFWRSFAISVIRVVLGTLLNMLLIVFTAYPLSKSKNKVHGRNLYMIFFALTMYIGGGMIPLYLVVSKMGLVDTIWALILPGALPVYNMIIMMNFMRSIPKEIEEAALIDGASPIQILFKVTLPLLKPALATITLFCVVGHWNDWFSGTIYMNQTANYPLQSYLQTLLTSIDDMIKHATGSEFMEIIGRINARTGRAAELVLAALPILVIYPFFQKYFTKGLIVGSVKD